MRIRPEQAPRLARRPGLGSADSPMLAGPVGMASERRQARVIADTPFIDCRIEHPEMIQRPQLVG